VFVVPANIDAPTSQASNALIAEGFQSASTGWQVLRDYARQFPKLQEEIRDERRLARPPIRAAVREDKARPSTKKEIDKKNEASYIDLESTLSQLTENQLKVVAAIEATPTQVDDIIEGSELSASVVLAELTMLELSGVVSQEPGKRFTLNVRPGS